MNDIALELARLHVLKGADFVRQLKMLVQSDIFKSVENERDIFAADANHREDLPSLLDAARKAVTHGNKVIFYLTLRAFVQLTLSSRAKAFIRCMT